MTAAVEGRPFEPLSDPQPPLTVLFDAECPFCRWTVAYLRRWDRDRRLRLRPFQDVGEHPDLAGLLAGRDLGRALHVVDGAGRVAAGGDAVLAIASLLPGGRGVVRLVVAVPPSRFAIGLAYRLVERLRPILSGVGLDGPVNRE